MFTDRFLILVSNFIAFSGVSAKTLSHRLFRDSKVLPELLAGQRTITLVRAERAMIWLSAHWPEGHDWPADIFRPAPEPFAARVSPPGAGASAVSSSEEAA